MKKELKLNETKKDLIISQKCADEVNEIMKKYNCFFSIRTVFEDGQIFQNVLIKEIKSKD